MQLRNSTQRAHVNDTLWSQDALKPVVGVPVAQSPIPAHLRAAHARYRWAWKHGVIDDVDREGERDYIRYARALKATNCESCGAPKKTDSDLCRSCSHVLSSHRQYS